MPGLAVRWDPILRGVGSTNVTVTYVVKVLLKTIPNLVLEDAYRIMEEAHNNGMACVIVCPQEEAEGYCDALRKCSLTSTIEPVSKGD